EGTDACVAPVLSLLEAPTHPHHQARSTFVEVAGTTQPAPAPRFSRTPCPTPTPPTTASDTLLAAWGLPAERTNHLRATGALPQEQ
ncbi:MAG TPA: CoA transferase, partial [Actinomycetota bacterium]